MVIALTDVPSHCSCEGGFIIELRCQKEFQIKEPQVTTLGIHLQTSFCAAVCAELYLLTLKDSTNFIFGTQSSSHCTWDE